MEPAPNPIKGVKRERPIDGIFGTALLPLLSVTSTSLSSIHSVGGERVDLFRLSL